LFGAGRKSPAPRRVIIADDHPGILRVVKRILKAEPHLEVAVELVETLRPDVAVLNVVIAQNVGI
jgi:DNA-binding NarL/FixJ family response regulator